MAILDDAKARAAATYDAAADRYDDPVNFFWERFGSATVERLYLARINAHDPTGIIALCTVDHVFIDSLGSRMSGRERLEQAWTGYFALFPDYRIALEFAASQDTLALACGLATATHAASQKTWRIRSS